MMTTVHLNERTLALRRPFRTAQGTVSLRRVLVLVVQDAAGHVGLGEAAPLPAFGGENPVACREALDAVLPKLPEFASRWLERDRADAGLGPLEKLLTKTPCARACVETALLDLYAQRHGKPLADLLRSTIDEEPCLRSLPVNALLSGGTGDELGEAAAAVVADGWRTIKLKVGGDPLAAAAQVAALREHVGRAVAIRVDANGCWDVARALAFCRAAEDLHLEYLEQPVPAEDIDGLAAVAHGARVPIAADESVRQPADIGRLASRDAAQVVILKPMALGGWRPTRQACELAQQLGLKVVITAFLDGSIGRALAAHCAAALRCCGLAQGLATGALLADDLSDEPLRARHGVLHLSEQAGLGVGTLLPEAVR